MGIAELKGGNGERACLESGQHSRCLASVLKQ
jgi:hypothetical protein